jgi:septal ring factor EnvC (AmiA/AmiB activator)
MTDITAPSNPWAEPNFGDRGPSREQNEQFAAAQQGRWQRWSTVSAAPSLTNKCKGPAADKIRALQADLCQRHQHVADVHESLATAQKNVKGAESRVLAAIDKDSRTMSDSGAVEQAHADALAALAELTETRKLHDLRLKRTTALAEQAQTHLDLTVTEHWAELSDALTPDAEKVSERIRKLTAEYQQKLTPLLQEWTTIRDAQAEIIGRTPELLPSDLPAEDAYDQSPVVSAEALERFRQLTTPEPEPVEAVA